MTLKEYLLMFGGMAVGFGCGLSVGIFLVKRSFQKALGQNW